MGEESVGTAGNYQLLTVDNTTYLMPNGESDVKKAVGIINSADALILERFNETGIISADLFRGVKIYGIDGNMPTSDVVCVLNFIDLASGRGGMGAQKSSLGDLMLLVMLCSLEAAKDSRRAIGENSIMKRAIIAEQTKCVFRESLHAATERRDAAILEATCAIVGAAVSIAANLASLGLAIAALKCTASATKSQSQSAAGDVDTAPTAKSTEAAAARAHQLSQLSQSISGLGNALSSLSANIGGLISAEKKFKAEIANANAEALRSYLQALSAEVGTSESAYRDASQQISQNLDLIKQMLNMLQSLRDSTIRNI
jgi:hypothetical protein